MHKVKYMQRTKRISTYPFFFFALNNTHHQLSQTKIKKKIHTKTRTHQDSNILRKYDRISETNKIKNNNSPPHALECKMLWKKKSVGRFGLYSHAFSVKHQRNSD